MKILRKKVHISESIDLLRVIEERDRRIRKLEYKVEKLEKEKEDIFKQTFNGSNGLSNVDYFKERIAKEIEENDKAIELFIECSHRIFKMIELLQTPSDLSN